MTLPRQKSCLESQPCLWNSHILNIIAQERNLKSKVRVLSYGFFCSVSCGGLGIAQLSFYFFTRTKHVSLLGTSADPGLLCLGFQHHWGFSVCKIFSLWNESWKPDINEPRPSLSLEWSVLFCFGIFCLGLGVFLTSCSLPSANLNFRFQQAL